MRPYAWFAALLALMMVLAPAVARALDSDNDGLTDDVDPDDDNDGVPDPMDMFPTNSAEVMDSDGDGIGNNADADDDGDGVLDAQDAFPFDKNETVDTDADGIGNNEDLDDDADGALDDEDSAPLDPNVGAPDADSQTSDDHSALPVAALLALIFGVMGGLLVILFRKSGKMEGGEKDAPKKGDGPKQ